MNQEKLCQLVRDAAELKASIDADRERLKAMQNEIAENMTVPPGKMSASIEVGSVLCKVTRKEEYKWDQDKLNVARAVMGDQEFLGIFSFDWKPIGKKQIDGFLNHASAERKQPVIDALTIKTTHSVSFSEAKEAAA